MSKHKSETDAGAGAVEPNLNQDEPYRGIPHRGAEAVEQQVTDPLGRKHDAQSEISLDAPLSGANYCPPEAKRQHLLIAKLQVCVDLLKSQQQNICSTLTDLFDLEHREMFKDFKTENLDLLHHQPGLQVKNCHNVVSKVIEVDIAGLLTEAGYEELCADVAAEYQWLAAELNKLVNNQHVRFSPPKAHAKVQGFGLGLYVYSTVAELQTAED